MKYDLLLKNAKVITADTYQRIVDWIAVKDGKIGALGTLPDCPEAVEIMDLEGKTVLPGLFDSHCHVMTTGLYLNSPDLLGIDSIEKVLEKIGEACRAREPGEWVFGVGFNAYLNPEQRYPDRWELDKVSEGHPVLIMTQTLHGCAMNSKAFDMLNVPDIEGVMKNAEGVPTGVLLSDDAAFAAQSQAMATLPDEKIFQYIKDCTDYAVKQGVTSMSGFFGQFEEKDRDVEIALKRSGDLPIDVNVFYQTWNVDDVLRLGLPRIGGCLTLDGAGFEYTMALNEPYPDKTERRGFLIHTDNEIYELISKAHKNNLQCTLHALGDRAIDQLIYVYLQVIGEQGFKDLRHRIEHFSLPTDKHMDLLAKLGLIASMQPAFAGLWGDPVKGEYIPMLGQERADRMEVFPEIIRRGGTICGGSDSPVTLINPLFGIASLISNPDPRRNVPVMEAVKIFTINGAYANGKDKVKGSIEVEKDADFTVIDKDLFDCAGKRDAYEIKVVNTIRGGKVIY